MVFWLFSTVATVWQKRSRLWFSAEDKRWKHAAFGCLHGAGAILWRRAVWRGPMHHGRNNNHYPNRCAISWQFIVFKGAKEARSGQFTLLNWQSQWLPCVLTPRTACPELICLPGQCGRADEVAARTWLLDLAELPWSRRSWMDVNVPTGWAPQSKLKLKIIPSTEDNK